jgi:hypothetical protein
MAALALAAVLPACGGGGGGTTPTTVPPAPQPTRTQIQASSFTVLGVPAANGLGFPQDVAVAALTVSNTGALEIVADWTFASSDIDIWFITGACTAAQAARRQCTITAATTSTTQKPERLNIASVTAGTYTIGFANFTNANESGNYQVYLTR